MTAPERGLLDTSVFIAPESGRLLDVAALPDEGFVSVVTLAELRVGVLAADDLQTRARRLSTLELVAERSVLPADEAAAGEWARMRIQLRDAGRRVNVNDLWIAAIAAAHRLPVVTQDDDFDVLAELGAIELVKV